MEEAPLDPERFLKLNELRKKVWEGAAIGSVLGCCVGTVIYFAFSKSKLPFLKPVKGKNQKVLFILLSGCLGSFLGSLSSGKNAVQLEYSDIFRSNVKPSTGYAAVMFENERNEKERIEESFHRREALLKKRREFQSPEDNSYFPPKS